MNGAMPFQRVDIRSVLIVADGDAADAATAIGLAGAAPAGHRTLAQAGTLGDAALVDAVIADVRGAAADAVESALAAIRAFADERGVPVVALLDDDQIDLVAAHLLDPSHQLLCRPLPVEIAVALVNARLAPGRYGGMVADESERLRQLNSEVARIAETLARLTRDDLASPTTPNVARDRPLGFGMPPIEAPAAIEPRDVRNLIRARRMRDNHFPADLFADPAWDMLLDLFAAELEHRRVSVSSLCIAAAVPGTTALRWIGTMVELGLFERSADPLDRRRAYITLSSRAREAMTRYFDAVRRAGLSTA